MMIYPVMTEKAANQITKNNTLVFKVDPKENKKSIKEYIEKEYNVKVAAVRVLNNFSNEKIAYVKLKKEFSARDLASKLGVL
ncbi:MAG: 50S ribosomal protein L23 [Candidatus Micrarchaeota archaeon]|nr:50S ribosomal protein L23 [Candidatus Micrarchaeota archaeon]